MKLLLTTLHSQYVHSSLALPCLAACCRDICGLRTVVREYSVNERPEKLLATLYRENADVIAFSCYIWNIEQTLRLAAELKALKPASYIILGGPEVSYGTHELMAANPQIDAVVRGEGEATFRNLMALITSAPGQALTDEQLAATGSISFRSSDEIITASGSQPPTDLDTIPSPFAAGMVDLAKPLVYVETSRGCPFSCAFCLSSAEKGVRSFSIPRIENDLSILMTQRAGTIKFVDRTFNYDPARADHIWQFILQNNRGSRFHFEIAADLLTEENLALLKTVPPDTFRFEIGVQSTTAATLAKVARKSDLQKIFAQVTRLRKETAIIIHLDLVAGLPGDTFDDYVASLDKLLALRPHHIQVEPLKMLKGTAMRKRGIEDGYSHSPYPPYRILKNSWLTYDDILRIEESSELLEVIYNSGRFAVTLEMLAGQGPLTALFTGKRKQSGAVLSPGKNLTGIFEFLHELSIKKYPDLADKVRDSLRFDYCMCGHPGNALPLFLDREKNSPEPATPSHPEIAARLSLPAGQRFRTFTAGFDRNYSAAGWPEQKCRLTFVYCLQKNAHKVLLLSENS